MKLARAPRHRLAAAVAIGALIVALPGVAIAQARFGDVPSSGYVHGPGIDYAVDAGITVGCEDGSVYCPNDAVTRGQMATFLHRASGNADGVAPSVDAATLEGHRASDFLRSDGTASDSDRLGGRDASDYVTSDDLPSFPTGELTVRDATESFPLGVFTSVEASCEDGEIAVAGGYETDGLLTLNVDTDRPSDDNGWEIAGTATALGDVTAFVSCLAISTP